MSATLFRSGLRSMISWAMRLRQRSMAALSRTTVAPGAGASEEEGVRGWVLGSCSLATSQDRFKGTEGRSQVTSAFQSGPARRSGV